VFIADINIDAAQSFVNDINSKKPDTAYCAKCDVNSWDDLTSAFSKALQIFDRLDYVFPIAGLTERQVIPKASEQQDVRKNGFTKPDLTVFDTNGTGMINLVLIAVQAFRGQEKRSELGGMRGKM
jgi:NADP-dependent 3-hydroxy acid dehydrogenase YdfG